MVICMGNSFTFEDINDLFLSFKEESEKAIDAYNENIGSKNGHMIARDEDEDSDNDYCVCSNGDAIFVAPSRSDVQDVYYSVDVTIGDYFHIGGSFKGVKQIDLTNMGSLNNDILSCLCNPGTNTFPNYFEGMSDLSDNAQLTYYDALGRKRESTVCKLREELVAKETNLNTSIISKGFLHRDKQKLSTGLSEELVNAIKSSPSSPVIPKAYKK